MHSKTKVVLVVFVLMTFAGLAFILRIQYYVPGKDSIKKHYESSPKFLYLVQTEACLPPLLKNEDAFGDGSLNFEVLALSFKQPCNDTSFSHVEYIFDNSSTWTTGRNLLFDTAMLRDKQYLYYIFLDDDSNATDKRTGEVAWRAIEVFLQTHEPAVLALDSGNQAFPNKVSKLHKLRGCPIAKLESVPGLWYDAQVNAFHYKAVKHLLPYVSDYDNENWWASQLGLIVRTEILFRGQFVLHRYIATHNLQHRPYPKRDDFSSAMFKRFTYGLQSYPSNKRVPKCAKILIDQWIMDGKKHGWNSTTLCLPNAVPKDVIDPCQYQCSLLEAKTY